MKLSIVVPCYNESANIPHILRRFGDAIQRPDIEVILVDNGSTDGSASVLSSLVPSFPFARTVTVEVNRGYGFGILAGLREAEGRYLGWTHADLQTDPGDCLKAIRIIESRGDPEDIYVKGLREERPLFDSVFTVGMSLFESAYLRKRLWDINAQPNVFPRTFFESWKAPPHDFSLDLYALYMARWHGLTVIRFGVRFPERRHGQSSWNTGLAAKWKFIQRTLDYSTRLRKELPG